MDLLKTRYEIYKREKEVVWHPEIGEKLKGKVEEISSVNTQYGLSTFIKIQAPDHVAVIFPGIILRNALAKNNVQEGDSIAITYKGIPSGKQYKNYSIRKVA